MEDPSICEAFAQKQASATHFVEETLDIIFHIFVLFTALCGLLQFVIGPTYTRVMRQHIDTLIQNIPLDLTPQQQISLDRLRPMLKTLQKINASRSVYDTDNNTWLFTYAHTISILLFLAFLVLIWVLRKMLGAKTWTPTTKVLRNNLLLIFPAILIAEFSFFELIAMHYSPLLPRDFLKMFSNILEIRGIQDGSAVRVVAEN